MSNFIFSFCEREHKIQLCAYNRTTQARNYEVVKLAKFNLVSWDAKKQIFVEPTEIAISNNLELQKKLFYYESLDKKYDFRNWKELKGFIKTGVITPIVPTLSEFINSVITGYEKPKEGKLPTKSGNVYKTLLHKLDTAKLSVLPISEINNDHFKQFGKWIKEKNAGKNYRGLMQNFKTIIGKARDMELTANVFEFNYTAFAPSTHTSLANANENYEDGIISFTESEYEKFVNFDVSKLKVKRSDDYYKELEKDTCILLYELFSRPTDILQMHWDNIGEDEKGKFCIYTPTKKKNYKADRNKANPDVKVYLSPRALDIINKYKGQSKAGYLLPYEMNNIYWDISDSEMFSKRYYKIDKLEGRINRFIKKVARVLEIKQSNAITMYAFRRSTITHALKRGVNPSVVAAIAGTSLAMIQRHYLDNMQLTNDYIIKQVG